MKSIYILLLFLSINFVQAQEKFLTKKGKVSFFSSTSVQDIEAINDQVLSIVDTQDGKIVIFILMKSFLFEKSLMQEHFNENYLESDIYPKAKFKGEIVDFPTEISAEEDVVVVGDITIHGVTKPMEIKTKLKKTASNMALTGEFILSVPDFNIRLPSVLASSVAKDVVVNFDFDYSVYSK